MTIYTDFISQKLDLYTRTTTLDLSTKKLDIDTIDTCIYHGGCSDGFGSAFVVWLYYKTKFGIERANKINFIPGYFIKPVKDDETEFIPLLGDEFVAKLKGKNILMCDFAFKHYQTLQILEVCTQLLIIDHHKGAMEELDELPAHLKIFDMTLSGVGMTYNHFYGKPLPLFLEHIQYDDLGKPYEESEMDEKEILPNNREFLTCFHNEKFDFEVWEKYLDGKVVDETIAKGKAWLSYQSILVDHAVKKADYMLHMYNDELIAVAYSNSGDLLSVICNRMINHFWFVDFAACYWLNLYRRSISYSLRSLDDRMDVCAVAKAVAMGGGHRNASGMAKSSLDPYIWPRVEDHGLLDALKKKTIGEVNGVPYVIYEAKEFHDDWNTGDMRKFIKRKSLGFVFVVFLTKNGDNFTYHIAGCDHNRTVFSFFATVISKDNDFSKVYEFLQPDLRIGRGPISSITYGMKPEARKIYDAMVKRMNSIKKERDDQLVKSINANIEYKHEEESLDAALNKLVERFT